MNILAIDGRVGITYLKVDAVRALVRDDLLSVSVPLNVGTEFFEDAAQRYQNSSVHHLWACSIEGYRLTVYGDGDSGLRTCKNRG